MATLAQKPTKPTIGMVRGKGTQTSDSIDAKLSTGESVLNAGATKALKALLKKTGGMTIDEFNELHAPKGAETKVVDGVLHAAAGVYPVKKIDNATINKEADAASAAMNSKLPVNNTPTFENSGLVGVASDAASKLGSRFARGVANIQEGASIPVSNAMEGTGKLLFGNNNKPSLGMSDDADQMATNANTPPLPTQAVAPIASIAPPTAAPDATAKAGVAPEAQAGESVNTGMLSAKLGGLLPNDKISASRSTTVNGSLSPTDNSYPTPFDPKKLQSEEVQQAMSNNTAMVGQDLTGRGITKGVGVGKNGSTLYSDGGVANLAPAPQVGAQPQKRLSEDQVRQLYRELPADSFSAAGMGGTTTQQRYDKQQLPQNGLNIAPQVDPNAQRNALIAQSRQSGNIGDKAIRDSAREQLAALDANARNDQDNKYKMATLGQNASQFEQQQQAALATAKNAATKDERDYQLKKAEMDKPFDVTTDTGQLDIDGKPIMSRQTMVKDKDGNFVPVKAKQQEATVTQADIDKKIANAIGLGFSQKEAVEALKLDHPEYFKGVK